jgi:hypothetical protein
MAITQTQFTEDLKAFILNHEYSKTLEPEVLEIPQKDTIEILLHDPDGDYEALQIIINGIP